MNEVMCLAYDIGCHVYYQDTEEYVEETLSIEDAEKELIRKALLRNRGKRKLAAQELKISERTLYRKIEKYNLEDL